MSNGNGKATLLETFKTTIQSPVGGWVLAVVAIGYISWLTMEDRRAIYEDMQHLRDVVMPVIRDGPKVAYENQRLIEAAKAVTEDNNRMLQEMRSWLNLPLENRSDVKEILRHLKKQEQLETNQ